MSTNTNTCSKTISIKAPASLIIFGEYFITEKNTEAFCIAIDPQAKMNIDFQNTSHSDISFDNSLHTTKIKLTCIMDKKTTDNAFNNTLYKQAYKSMPLFLKKYKKNNHNTNFQNISNTQQKNNTCIHITIDTSAFFHTHTNNHNNLSAKKGLGSSEVSAVLMCASLAILHGYDPLLAPNKAILALHATHTHKMWQNNKGSGYGVYTSIFGGMGMYSQRNNSQAIQLRKNTWHALPTDFIKNFNDQYLCWLWHNPSVSSQSSLQSYNVWKENHTKQWKQMYKNYKQTFKLFKQHTQSKPLQDLTVFKSFFTNFKNISIQLGSAIAVSTNTHIPIELQKKILFYKTIGAGNECCLGFSLVFPYFKQKPLQISKGIHYLSK